MEKKIGGIVPINLFDNVITIDTETGGLDPQWHAVLQVAIVASRGRELVVDIADTIGERTPKAMEVNGIDWSRHLETALSPGQAVREIEDFLAKVRATAPGKLIVAGHHTAFDVGFIRRLFELAGREVPISTFRSVDTQTLLFQEFCRGKLPQEALGLSAACDHYCIQHEGRHTALGDARATRELLVRLLHPGCHERGGLICPDVQRISDGVWVACEFKDLVEGDIFRMARGIEWGHPYWATSNPLPEAPLGNFGLQAERMTTGELESLGVPA